MVEGFGDVGELYPRVDHLLQRIDDYSGTHLVVILDDVDRLEDHDVLHDLHQASNVSMVLIAADESDLFDSFSDRLRSRLQVSKPVRLRSYRTDELVSILKDRVRWGLDEDAIDEAELEQIANAAAGDARSAIEILRWAAEIAERVNQPKITSKTVEKAIPPEEYGPRNRHAAKLSGHIALSTRSLESTRPSPRPTSTALIESVLMIPEATEWFEGISRISNNAN